MRISRIISAAVVMTALLPVLSGCQKPEGEAEKAGKAIDQAAEEAGQKLKNATEKLGQKVEKAGEKMQDAAKRDDK
jgi:vacuolar-type H+-ATPase subunit H